MMTRIAASAATTTAAVLLAVHSAAAQQTRPQDQATMDGTAAAFQRPSYSFLRQNEDWSALRHAPESARTDFWDPIKYVPLNDDGSIWASFGGDMRLRGEYWSNFAFGAPADDDETFALWRLRLHGDVHFGDNVRVFIEGKSALSTDRDLPGGKRTLDVDTLALEQAFVDLKLDLGAGNALVLRPGRQALQFGKQRLVSPLPWANTLRRWDGISAITRLDGWNIHGFATQFAPTQKYDFNDPDDDILFWGVYATATLPQCECISADLYYLGLERDGMIAFNGTAGDETRHTIGGRIFGDLGDSNFDYDVEAAYQFGEVGSGDVSAYMVAAQLGYAPEMWCDPRFFAGVDYASGDDDPGGDVETFNQLFPLGHAYYGYMDFVGRQNAVDLNAGVNFKPFDKTTMHLSAHYFLRADTSDALYNAGGGVVRAGGLSDEREIGAEIDFTVKYALDAHTTLEFGYSHFFAGDFIDESGSDDDMDFIYAQMQYRF